MSAITTSLYGLGAGAATNFAVFLPALVAAIAYFQFEELDPESRPVNVPTEDLLDRYDFIVVGGGSAGKYSKFLYFNELLNFSIPYSRIRRSKQAERN